MPANGHLLANGFGAGRTWLFDLTDPRTPKILTSFGAKGGFSHPHSFERLPNGEVLATFQYGEGERAAAHDHAAMGERRRARRQRRRRRRRRRRLAGSCR